MIASRNTALLTWLALEREAVWFYPLAGARVAAVAGEARKSARTHTGRRDQLLGMVEDDTTTVLPNYDIGPLGSAAEVSTAARDLERRIQAACLAVVAASDGDDRTFAVIGLRTAALAEITWSGKARAFPGMKD